MVEGHALLQSVPAVADRCQMVPGSGATRKNLSFKASNDFAVKVSMVGGSGLLQTQSQLPLLSGTSVPMRKNAGLP